MSDVSAPVAMTDVHRLNLTWLLRLRWAIIAGQTLTVLGVQYLMRVELPLLPLFASIAFEAATNVAVTVWLWRRAQCSEAPVAALITLDLLLFTGLLYFTGGPTNPFSSLYLVHIALSTLVLRPRLTWALVGLSLICSAGLFAAHVPLDMPHEHAMTGESSLHLKGMWVALGVSASFIVYFLSRVRGSLAERDRALEGARERQRRDERVTALATLAAGAAHELAQPLSTIAIIAKELERSLALDDDASRLEDARLIRAEVGRCKEILSELATGVGHAHGEMTEPASIKALVAAALDGLPSEARARVRVEVSEGIDTVHVPSTLLVRALKNVLANALSPAVGAIRVEVSARRSEGRLRLEVRDDGAGMPEAVRARATEPFFTTKPAGAGMGLGLFVTANLLEQLGGRLELVSEPGRGTLAALELPA